MRRIFLLTTFIFLYIITNAQVGIGITTPNGSSMLDVTSTTKGVLIPRMNSVQRKGIGSPAQGLTVYDLTTKSQWYYDGIWKELAVVGTSDSSFVAAQNIASSNNMSPGLLVTDSAGYIYDSGGPIGGYGNNENITMGIKFPSGAQFCKIQIISLNTEASLDSLRIFDASKSYTFSGNVSNQTLIFPFSYSSINLQFISNPSSTLAGFQIKYEHFFINSTNVQNLSSTNTGFYYIPEKIAVRGGFQTNNTWYKDSVGLNSFTFGYGAKAKGNYGFASGVNTSASGIGATATGGQTVANGDFSTAIGFSSIAGGSYSIAAGLGGIARAANSLVIGSYNDPILASDETLASSSSPLFIIGSGSSNDIRSNAFVVRKNGNVTLTGYLSRDGSTNIGLQMLTNGGMRIVTTNDCAGCSNTIERFKFDVNSGFVAKGILGVGTIPATGAGERMMWHPYKAAFRAGSIGSAGTQWDDQNVGFYTTAFGYNTIALGLSSFATGYQSQALGSYSNALGYTCQADGTGAVAIGYRCTADADYSTAIGQRASTNGHAGAMVFSDGSTTDSTQASANNQMSMRFAGGYRLFTNAAMTVGVQITAGGSSWSVISDVRKKENFASVSTEYFLNKLQGLRLGSWNYIGQAPASFRHYGPMAQDIYAAFGKDKFGTIGCDTLLASADMDGIMMIMLQGLEKRTSEQAGKIKSLEQQNEAIKKENETLRQQLLRIDQLEAAFKKLSPVNALKQD